MKAVLLNTAIFVLLLWAIWLLAEKLHKHSSMPDVSVSLNYTEMSHERIGTNVFWYVYTNAPTNLPSADFDSWATNHGAAIELAFLTNEPIGQLFVTDWGAGSNFLTESNVVFVVIGHTVLVNLNDSDWSLVKKYYSKYLATNNLEFFNQ